MLKSVEIKNFRGIKECKVEDLALINVFVGENNSGKSTILDATFWALKETITPSLRDVLTNRVRRNVDRPELFFNFNEDLEIKVSLHFTSGDQYSFEIKRINTEVEAYALDSNRYKISPGSIITIFREKKKDKPETVYCYTWVDTSLNETQIGSTVYKPKHRLSQNITEYAKNCELLLSHVTIDKLWDNLDPLLSEVKQDVKIENDYISRLMNVYNISYFEFLPLPINRTMRLVAFKDRVARVYGAFQGAGIQRGAYILALLETSKNTGLFIEEIETYQHPKALEKLARHMIDLAMKNNVQLFITTHSYHDALRYLYYAVPSEQRDDLFRCYVVERREDGTVQAAIENNIEKVIKSLYP